MKIERINENKIKVLIDKEEAREWNISLKSISENTPEVQEMFWSAIQQAEKDVDFMIDGAKLFVETVPETPEGFAMVITKVTNDAELNDAISSCGYKGKIKQTELRIKRKKLKPARREKHIYRFSSFDTLCIAAEEIVSLFSGRSSVYKCDQFYYLCLVPGCDAAFFEVENILIEFSAKVAGGTVREGLLNEHGEVMIEDSAIEILNEYFCVR